MVEAREVEFPGEKEESERGVACRTVHLAPCSFSQQELWGSGKEMDIALLDRIRGYWTS